MLPTKTTGSKSAGVLIITLLCCCAALPVTSLDQKDSEARQLVAHAETLCANWTETSFREATEQYDRATQIWMSTSDFARASPAALKSGDVYFLLSDYSEATKRYQNAETLAEKANDWLAKARALSHMGRLKVHIGKNDLARELLTQAIHLFEQHASNGDAIVSNAHAEALSNLAEVTYSKGDFVRASNQLDNALKIFQNDHKGEAKAHLFLSYIKGSIGETQEAVAESSRAGELYAAVDDKIGAALVLISQGLSHSRKSDFSRAIDIFDQARKVFRRAGDRHDEASTLLASGEAHLYLREYKLALDESEQALRLFETIGAFDGASVAKYQIAMLYDARSNTDEALSNDSDQALAYYEKCLQLSRAAGKVRNATKALTRIAKIYSKQRRYDLASKQYQKLLKFYESIGDFREQAIALNEYGDLLFQLDQKQKALDSYDRALSLAQKAEETEILVATLYRLANANLKLDAPESALPFIQRSVTIIEEIRGNVESPEFRASYFSGVQKNYELCISVLMQLERLYPRQGFAERALLVSEKKRARLLHDLVTESAANLGEDASKELIESERGLRALFAMKAQERINLLLAEKNSAELAEVEREMDHLRTEYQDVQARLRERNPNLVALEQSPSLTLEQIQKELDGGTMLLEYALGDEHSYLWAVTSKSCQSYELPDGKTIEDAAHQLYKLITARQATVVSTDNKYQNDVDAAEKLYPENAAHVSSMLLGPVAGLLGTKRLVFVTEGALQYIPFAALPPPGAQLARSSEVKDEASARLIETNDVVALPSMSTLIAIRRALKHPASSSKLVAVIADPVFSRSDERVLRGPASTSTAIAASDVSSSRIPSTLTRDAVFARLSHASEEADAISAVAPSGTAMVAKGFDASRQQAMSSDLGQYQIIHFATHGYLDNERPDLSGIVLTMVDRNGEKTDGLMSLYDIYNLNLSAELTVLSACQTALGKDIKGEGYVGLTHSFMSAGSKSVIASLWKVDDRATAFLMADFYESMFQKGMSPAAALRAAKLKMMRNPQWNAPYYWAGFVLQGEYRNHIAVEPYSWLRSRWMLLFLLSLIAGGLFVLHKRKRRFSPRPSYTE